MLRVKAGTLNYKYSQKWQELFLNGNEKVEKFGGQKNKCASECIPVPAPYFNPKGTICQKYLRSKTRIFVLPF
jgi:hypothetical protein